MRNAFSDALVSLALDDPALVLLTGDHGYALFDEFRKRCPGQYINAGIAEQNMVGMSAGLARVGFRPFVYGLSAFIPIRVLEQIKLDVAHDNLPVVLLGDGAGLVYSHLGTSHQSTEDIACARAIPGLTILSPADRHEMAACMRLAYDLSSPVYVRMGKADRGDVHPAAIGRIDVGKPLRLRQGRSSAPALIATGSMVRTALDVATEYPDAAVWSVPSIKPLGDHEICEIARASSSIVVLEEHSTLGGLGSAVAEITAEHVRVAVLRIGVNDRYSDKCGTYDYLLKEHGLDLQAVRNRMAAFLATL